MARPNVSVYINDDSFVIPGSFTGTSRGGLISYGGMVLALGTTAERKSGIMQIGSVGDWIQRLTTTDPIGGLDNSDGMIESRFTTLPSCFDMIFCDITNTSPFSRDVLEEDSKRSTKSSEG